MLQFLTPIWLLAIGAIILPLAIHLWNVKKGKTLKIGSIRLFGENSRQSSTSLRFQDLWLLLLRCLLLVILAMLLAGPLIMQKTPAQKARGWILIDQQHLNETYLSHKPRIDSLVQAGYETHYFKPGFEMFNLADTAKNAIPTKAAAGDNLSYWSLAKALDKQLPLSARAYIFTNNRQNRFTGDRPKFRSKIIWEVYNSPDSVYNSIFNSYTTQNDSLELILAQSQRAGLIYTREKTSLSNVGPAYELIEGNNPGIRFTTDDISSKTTDSSIITVDTSVMRIALFTDRYGADLAYLRAALQTVQSFSQRKISINAYRNSKELPEELTWLFWLSDLPLNESVKNKSRNIFTYQPGKTLQLNKSWILTKDQGSYGLENTALFKRKSISNLNSQQDVLWDDEMGKPLLTKTVNRAYTEFKFYSRFDPEWNDLVWDPRFPETILKLILPVPEKTNNLQQNDRQTLNLSQIRPGVSDDQGMGTAKVEFRETKLDKYFWILLIILFALERWASARQRSINANG